MLNKVLIPTDFFELVNERESINRKKTRKNKNNRNYSGTTLRGANFLYNTWGRSVCYDDEKIISIKKEYEKTLKKVLQTPEKVIYVVDLSKYNFKEMLTREDKKHKECNFGWWRTTNETFFSTYKSYKLFDINFYKNFNKIPNIELLLKSDFKWVDNACNLKFKNLIIQNKNNDCFIQWGGSFETIYVNIKKLFFDCKKLDFTCKGNSKHEVKISEIETNASEVQILIRSNNAPKVIKLNKLKQIEFCLNKKAAQPDIKIWDIQDKEKLKMIIPLNCTIFLKEGIKDYYLDPIRFKTKDLFKTKELEKYIVGKEHVCLTAKQLFNLLKKKWNKHYLKYYFEIKIKNKKAEKKAQKGLLYKGYFKTSKRRRTNQGYCYILDD